MKMIGLMFLMIFIMILLNINIVSAGCDDSTWTRIWNITYDDNSSWVDGYNCTLVNGEARCAGGQGALHKNQTINMSTNLGGNTSIRVRINITNNVNSWQVGLEEANSSSINYDEHLWGIGVTGGSIQLGNFYVGDNNVNLYSASDVYKTVDVISLANGSTDVCVDGTYVGNRPITAGKGNGTFVLFNFDLTTTVRYDYMVHFNISGVVPDITLPIVNATFNNTSPKINEVINISANTTDAVGLSSCQIITNQTGANQFFNFSLSGTLSQCSQNFTIGIGRGNVINFSVRVNDTSNNIKTNDTIITVQNTIPIALNVSITPLPLQGGDTGQCHRNFSDADNDIAGGNQSDWYVNKTLILEARNLCSLGGGNTTLNSNITFSARFNDTFNWSDWVNSSTINVGDSTAPVLNNCTLSSTSITDASGNTINLTCEATDVSSNIQIMAAYLNGTINKTLTFSFTQALTINSTYVIFQSSETLLVGSYSVSQVNVTDTSSNKLSNTTRDLHFSVTSAPSPSPSPAPADGGGGGGATTTLIIKEGIPLLSFGGLTLIDFTVLVTPSKKVKIIRFKNIGNVTFANAEVNIEGDAEKYIMSFVCDLNVQNCADKNINIKAGESKLLTLNGSFTKELGKGTSGAVILQEKNTDGNTYELNLIVSRPPLYSIAISPLAELAGIPELIALVVVYMSTAVLIIGGIWFATL